MTLEIALYLLITWYNVMPSSYVCWFITTIYEYIYHKPQLVQLQGFQLGCPSKRYMEIDRKPLDFGAPFCSDKHILFFLMTNAWLVTRLVAIAIRFYYTVEQQCERERTVRERERKRVVLYMWYISPCMKRKPEPNEPMMFAHRGWVLLLNEEQLAWCDIDRSRNQRLGMSKASAVGMVAARSAR